MKRNLKIFLLFSKYALKSTLQHPVGSFFFLIGKLLRFCTYFLFVSYLLSKTKFLAGYSQTETLIFYLTFTIIDTTSQLLFREVYRFRPLVINGELDTILIKPYHPFLRILVGGVDLLDLFTILIYIVMLIHYILLLPTLIAPNFFIFLLLSINGLVIATAFHIIVLALGILTTEVDHTIMIYRDLSRVAVMPIDIYKEPLRTFLTFVIPIGIMSTFPVKSLLGILSWQMIVVSFFVSLVLMTCALTLWDKALKKYQSWGG